MSDTKFDEWVKHSIDCVHYGNTTKEQAVKLLSVLYVEINKVLNSHKYVSSKRIYEDLLEQIQALLDQYRVDYKKLLKAEIRNITTVESNWLESFYKDLGAIITIPATILSSVKFSPIASQTDYIGMVDNISDSIFQNVNKSLKTAYLTKEPVNQVSERINKRAEKIEKNVETETETFNDSTFALTDYLIFKANKIKVRYSSMLDSNTCSVCGSYDGMEFDSDKAPLLPIHENCRCELIPLDITQEDELSYKDWFETQSEDTKKEILGKGRYELYTKFGLASSDFVNNGEKLSLDELYEKFEK